MTTCKIETSDFKSFNYNLKQFIQLQKTLFTWKITLVEQQQCEII